MRKLSKKGKAAKQGLAVLLALLLLVPNLPMSAVQAEEDAAPVVDSVPESGETATPPEGQTPPEGGGTVMNPDGQTPSEGGGTATPPEGQTPLEGSGTATPTEGQTPPENGGTITPPEGQTPPESGGTITLPDGQTPPEGGGTVTAPDGQTPGKDVIPDSVSGNTAETEGAIPDTVSENALPKEDSGYELEKMVLHVGGDEIAVYPQEEEQNDGIATLSLQPLEEKWLQEVDLTAYTPAELTMVSTECIFKNGETASAENIIWTYYDDDYTVSAKGDKLDLSWSTYYSGTHTWEMIVGSADQLDTGNIRYFVPIRTTASKEWLISSAYKEDEGGNKTELNVRENSYYDSHGSERRLDIELGSSQVTYGEQVYITLAVNSSVFSGSSFSRLKMFEGQYASATEAESQKEITEEICHTGYAVAAQWDQSRWVTIVTYDDNGAATGCLPFQLQVQSMNDGNYISGGWLYEKNGTSWENVYDTSSTSTTDGCTNRTYTLYAGYPAENTYYLRDMDYRQAGEYKDEAVTAAYAGQFDSIEQATAAGADNIKEALFGSSEGYPADYSKGVYFTIFVGADGAGQEVYHYCITAKAGTTPKKVSSSATYVNFTGLNDAEGNYVKCYPAKLGDDSYGDRNFVTILVENTVDLTKLAPVFTTYQGMNLYAKDQRQPEESGKSVHDFSKGAVHYTASAENKEDSQNYWLQIVPVSGGRRLYINSLDNEEAETREESGVIYSKREMLLDAAHEYRHDILLLNIGTQDIENLAVELVSNTVELDEYWTLNGKHKLSAVTAVNKTNGVSHGELSNMAKLRLRKKDGIAEGAEVEGTLTIKSGNETLMVLTLTGIVGNPRITTETIPQGVKYVPYGIMIQNNNKYKRNKVSYQLLRGSLPGGMELMPNGELYGVPTEAGEYTFTVRMTNSLSDFSNDQKTYTLTVLDNTNANVDGATDQGYDLTERVEGAKISASESQTLVSQGEYAQFKYVFLDGVKLTEGSDYTSEAGSTRITIRNQTLALSRGRHTIGVEFRTQDDSNTLHRAAQNYVIGGGSNSGSGSSSDNSDTGSGGGADNGAGAAGGADGSAQAAGSALNLTGNSAAGGENATVGTVFGSTGIAGMAGTANNGTPVSYTIQEGDTLWKIAGKFYGSGALWRKIYLDNVGVIDNPDMIRVGQVITIHPAQGTAATGAAAAATPEPVQGTSTAGTSGQTGTYYTVESGDTLWKIAKKYYGRGWQWRKIYDANREQISDSAQISVGQVIYIPE